MRRVLGAAALLAAALVVAAPQAALALGAPTPPDPPVPSLTCTPLGVGLLTFTFTNPDTAQPLTVTAHIANDPVLGLQPGSATARPGQMATGPQTVPLVGITTPLLVRDGNMVTFTYHYLLPPNETRIGGGITVHCGLLGNLLGPPPPPGQEPGLNPSTGALQRYNPPGGPSSNYPATAQAGPVYGSPPAAAAPPINNGYTPSPDAPSPTANPTAPPPTTTPAANPGQTATRPALAKTGASAFGQHGMGLALLVVLLLGLSGVALYAYNRFDH